MKEVRRNRQAGAGVRHRHRVSTGVKNRRERLWVLKTVETRYSRLASYTQCLYDIKYPI